MTHISLHAGSADLPDPLAVAWRCVETSIISPEPMILGPDGGHRGQTTR
jgi:hypothetical protein